MTRVLEQVRLASGTRAGVCLIGESGVGREHAARAIHYAGPGGEHSFVPLDSVALPPDEQADVIDRMLGPSRPPVANVLQPGALFLAEVDRLPRDIQQRLLDRLGEFVAHDHNADDELELRLMASATRPLEQAVADEDLLPELHFRLSAITISLPPLRDRSGGVQSLALHFM